MPFTCQDPNVRSSKRGVAQRVADRVYRRVYVAQSIKERPKFVRYAPSARRQWF